MTARSGKTAGLTRGTEMTIERGPYSVSSTAEMEDIAETAAEKALHKLFLTFGVNTSDPDAVLSFQDDLRHVHKWRKSTEAAKDHLLKTVIGVLVTGALGWLAMILWRHQ
jgi:hypothetical protein